MAIRFEYLKAAWFRGFCDEQFVAFPRDAMVLYGPNGSGKSNVVEAIEWVLFGQIGRAARALNRQEYASQRHVVNPRRPTEATTYVELGIEKDGQSRVLRRELVDLNTTRLLLDGSLVPSANAEEALEVSTHEMQKPFISRWESRLLLDATPSERWERIVSLLGVDLFARARQRLLDTGQRVGRDPDLMQAESTRIELLRCPGLEHVAEVAGQTPYSRADLRAALLSAVAREGIAAETPEGAAEALLRLARPARPPLPVMPSTALLSSAAAARTATRGMSAPPTRSSDEARRAFLRSGLALVGEDDTACPFCGQPTINPQLLETLNAEVDSLAEAAERERERALKRQDLRTAAAGLKVIGVPATFLEDCRRAGADYAICRRP